MAEPELGLCHYVPEPSVAPVALPGQGSPSRSHQHRSLPSTWHLLVGMVPVSPSGGALLRKFSSAEKLWKLCCATISIIARQWVCYHISCSSNRVYQTQDKTSHNALARVKLPMATGPPASASLQVLLPILPGSPQQPALPPSPLHALCDQCNFTKCKARERERERTQEPLYLILFLWGNLTDGISIYIYVRSVYLSIYLSLLIYISVSLSIPIIIYLYAFTGIWISVEVNRWLNISIGLYQYRYKYISLYLYLFPYPYLYPYPLRENKSFQQFISLFHKENHIIKRAYGMQCFEIFLSWYDFVAKNNESCVIC